MQLVQAGICRRCFREKREGTADLRRKTEKISGNGCQCTKTWYTVDEPNRNNQNFVYTRCRKTLRGVFLFFFSERDADNRSSSTETGHGFLPFHRHGTAERQRFRRAIFSWTGRSRSGGREKTMKRMVKWTSILGGTLAPLLTAGTAHAEATAGKTALGRALPGGAWVGVAEISTNHMLAVLLFFAAALAAAIIILRRKNRIID